jgi:PAS domain S-box-containing protein
MSLQTSKNVSEFKHVRNAGKIVWLIVLVACLILLGLVVIVRQAASQEREQAFANAIEINSKIALSDEVRITSVLGALDKVMLVMRRDFSRNAGLTYQELILRLEELKVDNELNPHLSFADASGEVLLSSARSNNGQKLKLNVSDREYFQRQKSEQDDQLHVGGPIQSRITGKWVVPLTRRITNKDGSFGGVLNMTVEPSLFTQSFVQTSLGVDATRALIGLDGYTLLRMNGGKLVFGGDTRKSQLFNELKRSKVGNYTAIASSDGVQRTVSYRLIEPYGIVILAGSSVASIEKGYGAKVQAYVITASLFGVLIVALTGLLIVGILRQATLIQSQQSFIQLIELVPQLVSRLDENGNIVWVNNRTVEFVGPSVEEQISGYDWVHAAIHAEDQDRVQNFVASALERHQVAESCEYRKRRFDGTYLWFSSQITKVHDRQGADASYLQTGTDIHDRKMAEERTRVTQKMESIGQLTGGMAHDFNNLLAIIVGNLDLAKPQVTAVAASRQIEVAIGAAKRGVGLVKSLLALASKQPLLPARIDLLILIERIAPLLKHAVGQRVNFDLNVPTTSVQVEVDEAGLEAVLLNLCVNARDAMSKGGDLCLSLDVSDGMAHIAIADTGTGMSEAVLKRATEPFFTTKERGRGTGLGLSMVAGFVKQSGGKMQIQSTEGKGTTIEIFLPLAAAVQAAKVPMVSTTQHASALQVATSTGKRKILIVDDETELAELVRAWAKEEGHAAVLAHSADDALTLLEVRAFDVMLTDIMMPGQMDGIGLAERASALYPTMKILLMSGYSKETATNRSDVPWPLLVKPFARTDFDAAIENAFAVSDYVPLA